MRSEKDFSKALSPRISRPSFGCPPRPVSPAFFGPLHRVGAELLQQLAHQAKNLGPRPASIQNSCSDNSGNCAVQLSLLRERHAVSMHFRVDPFWRPGVSRVCKNLGLDVFVGPWRSAHGTCGPFHVTDQLDNALCKILAYFLALQIFDKIYVLAIYLVNHNMSAETAF